MTLLDAAALDVFFEDAGNMGLSNRTRSQLAHEGIADPEDFKEFDEDELNAIFSNLYKPPKVPAPGAVAIAAGRLLGATKRVRYLLPTIHSICQHP